MAVNFLFTYRFEVTSLVVCFTKTLPINRRVVFHQTERKNGENLRRSFSMTSHGENLRASLREVQRFLETVMSNQIKSSKSNVTHWEQFWLQKFYKIYQLCMSL